MTPDDLAKALSYFEKAIELDPNYARTYAALALTYWHASIYGWYKNLGVSWTEARLLARQYLQIAMNKPTSIAYQLVCWMNFYQRRYEEAIDEAQRAIGLDPNNALAHTYMAVALIWAGRPEEAVDFAKDAKRLDPHTPYYLICLGLAQFCMGKLEEAVAFIERALTYYPESISWSALLAAAYAHLGREQEARAALDNYRKGWPYPPTLQQVTYFWPFKGSAGDRFADGLIKAGLPGQRPGYNKVSKEHRLTGKQIRALFFGRTLTGLYWGGEQPGPQWWLDLTTDGKATYRGGTMGPDSGTGWIEGDMLYIQWQTHFQGRKYCFPVFRNPLGTPESKNEYLLMTDFGIWPCSPVE